MKKSSQPIFRSILSMLLGVLIISACQPPVLVSVQKTTRVPGTLALAVAPDTLYTAVAQTIPSDTPVENATVAVVGTPVPSTTPLSGYPIRAAFYYPWFPEAWTQQGFERYTNYHPALGFYNSDDQAVINKHIDEMMYGHITVGISSWWGQGSPTDGRVKLLLSAATGSGFRWALYYEPEGQGNPDVGQITRDLQYIRDQYSNDPSYLKINDRFVVFVYTDAKDRCEMVDRWKQANTVNAFIVLRLFPGYNSCASQPDGWHQYAPAVASNARNFSVTISPGFWQAGDKERLARDLTRWNQNIRAMVASQAKFQLISTFNEWGEGTAIEPAQEWQSPSGYGMFLDALHNNGVEINLAQSSNHVTPIPESTDGNLETTQVANDPIATPTLMVSDDPVLVGAADVSVCGYYGAEATAHLLDYIPGTVFLAGDGSDESGSLDQYNNCFDPAWGRFKDRIMPVPGNHDYYTGKAADYFTYFGAEAGDPQKGYYSYDVGTWHIIMLNSNCSQIGGCRKSSPMEKWLAADLQIHSSTCSLAIWHTPLFSSGEHGNYIAMQDIWTDLYKSGVEMVINGHDHDYERFAPQDPTGKLDPVKGIVEFVVGTGGASHRNLRGDPIANSQATIVNTFGVLRLVLHNGSYDYQFVPEAGKVGTDSGSGTCH